MAQKNIYMVQPTYKNGACVYFPYAIGALVSYAWKFADIADNYVLRRSFILREDPDAVLEKTENPFLVGFSCYMWNMEYNKVLARKIKERYPRCMIVFGGQQIPDGTEVLEACPYVDILIHREGEVPFRDLLRALLHNTPLSAVKNISYRTADTAVQSAQVLHEAFDFPSPYASGYFERLIRLPGQEKVAAQFRYDFHTYFHRILSGEDAALQRRENRIEITIPDPVYTWQDYARKVMLFAKRRGDTVLIRDKRNVKILYTQEEKS